MFCRDAADVVFENLRIENCRLRRATSVEIENSDVLFSNCVFQNNRGREGGAISARVDGIVEIQNSEFRRNVATNGGGAVSLSGTVSLEVSDSRFVNNQANSSREGRPRADGGAISASNSDLSLPTLSIRRCTFTRNSAEHEGGAVHVFGFFEIDIRRSTFLQSEAETGGACVFDLTDLEFTAEEIQPTINIVQSAFLNNTANQAGAMLINGSFEASLSDSDFNFNVGTLTGGAVYGCLGSRTTGRDLSFEENRSIGNGTAIYLCPSEAETPPVELTLVNVDCERHFSLSGACVFAGGNAQVSISDSAFAHNSGNYGGCVTAGPNSTMSISNTDFRRCIGRHSGGGIYGDHMYALRVNGSRFRMNQCDEAGGGINVESFPSQSVLPTPMMRTIVNVDFSIFRGNTAREGGAMHVGPRVAVNMSNCDFINNRAAENAGALFLEGIEEHEYLEAEAYGIETRQAIDRMLNELDIPEETISDAVPPTAIMRLENVRMIRNNATRYGGAMELSAGSLAWAVDCAFDGNGATWVGGIFNILSVFNGRNLAFRDNYCEHSAGALMVQVSHISAFEEREYRCV